MERVEFGSGLRSHIAREPEAALAPVPFGPVPEPVPAAAPAPKPAAAEWVRDLLRVRAGEQAERIWEVFDAALRATDADGGPDHELRLRAARALLDEVYGPPAAPSAEQAHVLNDELARYRLARQAR